MCCGDQRKSWGSQFFPSSSGSGESNSGHQTWYFYPALHSAHHTSPPHPPPPPALWDSVRCVTSPGRGTHNIDQADWKLTEIPSARLLWAKEWIPGQPGYTKTLSHQQSKKCKQSKTIATAEPQSLWGSNTWAGNWVSVVASSPQWGSESLSICLSDRVPLFWWVGYCLFEIQSFLCIPFLSINAVVTLRAVFREGQMMSAAFLFTLS